jgi:hypothetical protein
VYQPVKKARTTSWMSVFGAFSATCTPAVQQMGPAQSCGARGSPNDSANEAIAFISVTPPHQPGSNIT